MGTRSVTKCVDPVPKVIFAGSRQSDRLGGDEDQVR